MFIDFQKLKEHLEISDVIRILQLDLKVDGNQLRGSCPKCGGDRSLIITPEKSVFYCQTSKKGGDFLSLAAHTEQLGVKDAAIHLAERSGFMEEEKEDSMPETPEPTEVQAFQPLKHLDFEGTALSPDTAEALGVGKAKRGIMRGRVVFPLYQEGVLVGYVGIKDGDLKFPNNLLEERVVELEKKAHA